MRKAEHIGANTVLVDMDGVLADFEEPNNAILRTHFPDIPLIVERPNFYYAETYQHHADVGSKLYRENRRPGFFLEFPIIDQALQGWQRILDAGFTPRVCSSPLENHATVIAEKKAWLEELFVPEFGAWVVDTAIFDRDKSGYHAFAMIDDRPTLRNSDRAVWQHIVFSKSYNADIETDYRLNGWNDPALEAILSKTHENYLANLTS